MMIIFQLKLSLSCWNSTFFIPVTHKGQKKCFQTMWSSILSAKHIDVCQGWAVCFIHRLAYIIFLIFILYSYLKGYSKSASIHNYGDISFKKGIKRIFSIIHP